MKNRNEDSQRKILLAALAALTFAGSRAARATNYYWDTTTTGLWSTGSDWSTSTTGSPAGMVAPTSTDSAVFDGSGVTAKNETINLNAATTIAGMTFSNGTFTTLLDSSSTTSESLTIGSGGITLSGGGTVIIGNSSDATPIILGASQTWSATGPSTLNIVNAISGTGNLTLGGSGTFTMDGGTSFTGNLIISGASRVNFDSGTFGGSGIIQVQTTGAALTNSNSAPTSGLGTVSYAISLNSNNATFTAGSFSTTTYTEASFVTAIGGTSSSGSTSPITFSGVISGNSDVIIANSTGGGGGGPVTLGLSGTSGGATGYETYTGNTIFTGNGTVTLAAANVLPVTTNIIDGLAGTGSPTLNLNGFNQQVGYLADGTASPTATLSIVNNSATSATLTFGDATTPGTAAFSGTIANGTGTLSLAKTGADTISLSGNNTFTGGITINQGTLTVSGTSALGAGAVTVNPSGASGTSADAATLNTTNSAIGNHNAVFTINSNSTTAIGTVNFTSGSAQIGALMGNGSVVLQNSAGTALTIGSTLNLNSAFTGAISEATPGQGSIIIDTTGTVLLGGVNTYTGATTITEGKLQIGGAGQLASGSYAGAISDSGTLEYSSTASQTFSNAVSGNGGLTKDATSSTLTLSGADNYSGATALQAGTLVATQTSGTPFGTNSFTLGGGTLAISPSGGSGTLTLTVAGNSTTTLFAVGNDATLLLNKGPTATALKFVVGDGGSTQFSVSGALVITPASGLSKLGTSSGEQFTINATTTPAMTDGIVSPDIVGEDTNGNGNFLAYGASGFTGFSSMTTFSGTNGDTNFSSPGAAKVEWVSSTPSAIATQSVYALRADANVNLASNATLTLGSGGLIINNGSTISGSGTATLAFGSNIGEIFTGTGSASLSTLISGTNGINVFGPGTLTLSGMSAFTGGVVAGGGTLSVGTLAASGTNSPLGSSGTVSLNGATLSYTGATTSVVLAVTLLNAGGTINLTTAGATLTLSGLIIGSTLAGLTFSGPTTGSPATLVLSDASNTYSGRTTVSTNSNLSISGDHDLGTAPTSYNPCAVMLNGTATLTTTATLAQSANRGISGTGSLVASSGTLTLNSINTYTGGTYITGGTIALGANNALPPGGALTMAANTTFSMGAFNQTVGSVTLNPASSITSVITGTGTLTLAGNLTLIDPLAATNSPVAIATPINLNGATRTFNVGYGNNAQSTNLGDLHLLGVISNSSGTAGLTISPWTTYNGTVYLDAANTYNGPTTLSASGGGGGGTPSIYLGVNNAIPNGSAFVQAAGTILDLTSAGNTSGISTGMGSLTGAGSIVLGSTGILTIGYDNTSPAAYSGAISGTGGSIVKTGAGTMTLSGANTYTGGTTVGSGTLALTAGSLADTAITVASGATFSPAPGTTVGNTTNATLGASLSIGSGATLNLANAATGTFTLAQGATFKTTNPALTLSGSGTINAEIGTAGPAADEEFATTGTAVASGTNTIKLIRTSAQAWTTFPLGTTFVVANVNSITADGTLINTSNLTTSNAADQIAIASAFTVTDNTSPGGPEIWSTSVASDAGGGVDIEVTVTGTPEPSSLSLLGFAALGLLRRRQSVRR